LEKSVTLERKSHTGKNEISLEKWLTHRTMGHFWKAGSNLVKRGVTLGKNVKLGKKVANL